MAKQIKSKTICLLSFKEVLRLLHQCYRHGYYCIFDDANFFDYRHVIVLQKCCHRVYIMFPESHSDIWHTKHTWNNYLQSKGVI